VRLAIGIKTGRWPAIGSLFPDLAAAPAVRFGARTMRYLWPDPAAAVLFPRHEGARPLLGEGGSVLPATDAD